MSVTRTPCPEVRITGRFAWLSAGCAIGCQTWRAFISRRKLSSKLWLPGMLLSPEPRMALDVSKFGHSPVSVNVFLR